MPPPVPELAGVEHSHHHLPSGVRVHLAAAGPPGAPPLLALHGRPQHWWYWRDMIGAVELVDRAGHFLPEEAPGLVAGRIRAAD